MYLLDKRNYISSWTWARHLTRRLDRLRSIDCDDLDDVAADGVLDHGDRVDVAVGRVAGLDQREEQHAEGQEPRTSGRW